MNAGDGLKALRAELGLSQNELASALHTSFTTINRWENGKTRPSRMAVQALLEFAKKSEVSSSCYTRLEDGFSFNGKRHTDGARKGQLKVDYELLGQLVDEAAAGVYVADYETDELLYLNLTGAKMLGVDANQIAGKRCYEFMMKTGDVCPFCHKEMLTHGAFWDRSMIYPPNGRQYRIRSKLLTWNGRKVHVHYVTDETALLAQQKEMRTLTDHIPAGIGIYHVYPDGRLESVYLNDVYYSLIGVDRGQRSQYQGLMATNALCDEDMPGLKTEIAAALREKRQLYYEMRIKLKDGGFKWVCARATITEQTKERSTLYCVFADIDQLKRTQESLQQQYQAQVRYNRMLSSAAVASSMVNLTKNCITLQNTEDNGIMEIITKQTPQQGFESMYPHIPDERILREYSAIFNTEAIIADFEKGVTSKSIRHPYDTVECWLESSYNAVRNPQTGDLEVYCIAKDVSGEQQQKNVVDSLMTNEYEDVLLIDAETGKPTILVSDGTSAVYEEQKLAGDFSKGLENYFLKLSADDDPMKVAESAGLAAVRRALESQNSYSISYSVYDADHKIIRKRASYSYLNAYRRTFLCKTQNITADFEKEIAQRQVLQSALEQARQASSAKTEFFSRMSHDMRTPMNGIMGLAELAEDETDPAALHKCIAQMRESGQYLLSLINDTLDFQRIESGKMTLDPKVVSANELFYNIVSLIRPMAKKKGVDFRVEKDDADLSWDVRLDPVRMKQIFINLLSNAVKFTAPGGVVQLSVHLVGCEGMISHCRFTISDTGIGISEAYLKNGIFKPFSQENNAVTSTYAGSGLGLSIAKSLVELMGGKMTVESELGAGTTFVIDLDFERVDAAESVRATKAVEHRLADLQRRLKGKRVLLAEDHPLNAEIAVKLLERVGCEATWVRDGRECVEVFQKLPAQTFDAILMDIRMPGMDGLEAAGTIRALNREDAETIPILAMTANAYEEDVKKSFSAGMNAHIPKPIDPAQMYAAIAKLIEKQGVPLCAKNK